MTSFAFGNPGTFWATYLVDLHANGAVYGYDAGDRFPAGAPASTRFAFGSAGTPFAGDLVGLQSNGTLTANTPGGSRNGLEHPGATSFAFGNPGTFWAGYLADLHGNGVMEGNDGMALCGFAPWGSGYTSFAFGPAGTPFAGDLVRLRSDGTLTANTQGGGAGLGHRRRHLVRLRSGRHGLGRLRGRPARQWRLERLKRQRVRDLALRRHLLRLCPDDRNALRSDDRGQVTASSGTGLHICPLTSQVESLPSGSTPGTGLLAVKAKNGNTYEYNRSQNAWSLV